MLDIQVIEDPAAAAVALDPMRSRLLAELAEPASAATLAARVGLPRQKVNYHLRTLEAQGLVELAEERRRGGITERVLRATAATYVISPAALGESAVDPERAADRFSAGYLVALAGRVVAEVGGLSRRAEAAGRAPPDHGRRQRDQVPVGRGPGGVRRGSHGRPGRARVPLPPRRRAALPPRRRHPPHTPGEDHMTTPDVPRRFELTVELPGTPEQVWAAIATGPGISSWFLRTEIEGREGGVLVTYMGEGAESRGEVTGWDPPRRLEYAEPDWADLTGRERRRRRPAGHRVPDRGAVGRHERAPGRVERLRHRRRLGARLLRGPGEGLGPVLRPPRALPARLRRPGGRLRRGGPHRRGAGRGDLGGHDGRRRPARRGRPGHRAGPRGPRSTGWAKPTCSCG